MQNVVYDDVCIRNTATPIDIETTYIDANAPRTGWINGKAFPLYPDIVLHNVQTEGGTRLRLTGVDAQHATKIQFDGVRISGIETMKQQVSHARIMLGPGPSNWIPSGDDVKVSGRPSQSEPASCSQKFVPFPVADER